MGWARLAFDVAVVEKRWSWDVDGDDAGYGAGVVIKGHVEAVIVGRKKYRVCAGIPFVVVDLLVRELFDV